MNKNYFITVYIPNLGNIENYITLNSDKDLSDITRWDGRNSLHLASSNMTKPRPDEAISKSIQLLLDNGFNPNSIDNFGLTPLHYAVKNNNKTAIRLLLKAGANPNASGTSYGNSPLHYAATLGVEEFIRPLVAAGGKLNHSRKDGDNSLDIFREVSFQAVSNEVTLCSFLKSLKVQL